MSISTLDDLLKGGGKSAKFDNPGDSVTGKVVSVSTRQATDFATGEPQFWDNGDPQIQAVISIQTNLRDPEIEDDDGLRSVYIKMWGGQKRALQAAAREAGRGPAEGDTFTATFLQYGPKPQKGFPAKEYEYKIEKGSPLSAALSEPAAPAQAAPAQPAAPAQQAAAPAPQAAVDEEQVKKLIGLGLQDEQIAQALSIFAADVARVRTQAAADSSAGF